MLANSPCAIILLVCFLNAISITDTTWFTKCETQHQRPGCKTRDADTMRLKRISKNKSARKEVYLLSPKFGLGEGYRRLGRFSEEAATRMAHRKTLCRKVCSLCRHVFSIMVSALCSKQCVIGGPDSRYFMACFSFWQQVTLPPI